MWICKEFKCLPTEERFLNLYEEQKVLLYCGINNLPPMDNISASIKYQKELEEIKLKKKEHYIKGKEGSMIKMRQVFKTQGLDDKKIEKEIDIFIEKQRQLEMQALRKKYFG